jgi:Domain of unknown function (DUF3821)
MNMKNKTVIPIVALVTLGFLIFACPVSATIQTIPSGGTVFLGEQGLDISGPAGLGAVTLGWWASGADIATTSPYTVNVQDTKNFNVDQSTFGSHMGSWYLLPAKTQVFTVADPQLAIRVEDTTVGVDVTDRWVPTGDAVRFRIESNLAPILQRGGVTSVPITIRVHDPLGGEYTSLLNTAGVATPLVIPVTTTPFYTDSIWDTGQRASYSPGAYTIWAECNVNSMKDNYNVVGKTTSQTVSLLDQDQNPLIRGNNPATTTTTTISVATTIPVTTQIPSLTPTTVPKTTTPISVESPVPVITTEVPASPSGTQLPVTVPQTPVPTKSPGFEGILACFAALIGLVLYTRSD